MSLIPCNSVYRGYDMDEVDARAARHLRRRRQHAPTTWTRASTASTLGAHLVRDERSVAVHAARLHAGRGRSGAASTGSTITGTSNQSDYLSHFVANHMFFRLALPGARRVLIDHIAWCQRARAALEPAVGRRPAHAAGRRDAGRGDGVHAVLPRSSTPRTASRAAWTPTTFLPRFTFFFDISISFFEEIAKFRAGRRIWARLARERLGAKDPTLVALQVPRPDLGRRPDAPAAAQQHRPRHRAGDGRHLRRPAVAAHRRLRRGAVATPSEAGARIAVATQNILREEAHLTDVIDPLGGSYYVEALTDADGGRRSSRSWRRSTTPAACTRRSRPASCSG